MQKLDRSQHKNYGPVILWAEDLTALVSELETCEEVEIVADDVKYESIEELIRESKGRRPLVVKITALNPHVSIELNPHRAWLYVSSSNLQSSGLFFKVDSILSHCERKLKFFYEFVTVMVSATLLPNIFFLPFMQSFMFLHWWVFGATFAWLFYAAYINFWKYSLVHLVRRGDRPSFVKRNFDTIVIAIISALLGAVIGAAATKVVDRIWPSGPNPPLHSDEAQAPRR
jgi:hypothetical protein